MQHTSILVFSRTVTPIGFLIRLHKQQHAETTDGMLPNNNKIEICSLIYYRCNICSLVVIIKQQNM